MLRMLAKTAVLASLALGLVAAPAAASTGDDPTDAHDGKHCAVYLGKAPAGELSPVLAKACSDVSLDAAQAAMQSKLQATARARGENANILAVRLVNLYQHINYNRQNSGSSTGINVGADCDSAGYRFEPDNWWKANVSSVLAGTARCNFADVYNRAQTSAATFDIRVDRAGRWLGGYSDNVHHFQIYRGV